VTKLRAFGAFWYDFVIGDDWRIAVAVVLAFAATYGVSRTDVPAWWIVPVVAIGALAASLWRGAGRKVRRG
jgi:hypothetical protein